MGRTGWTRLATVAAALGLVSLLSGCVVLDWTSSARRSTSSATSRSTFTVCASGSTGCGNWAARASPPLTGTGQVLLGVLVQDTASLPSSLTSTGPEALTFTPSPSYAAELERLEPGAGREAAGSASSPGVRLRRPASGASVGPRCKLPSTAPARRRRRAVPGPSSSTVVIGGVRVVSAVAPASRPVVCGPSTQGRCTTRCRRRVTPTDVWVICADDRLPGRAGPTRDLGVLNGAAASGPPGGVATLPFVVRYAGTATPAADFRLPRPRRCPAPPSRSRPHARAADRTARTQAQVAVGDPRRRQAGHVRRDPDGPAGERPDARRRPELPSPSLPGAARRAGRAPEADHDPAPTPLGEGRPAAGDRRPDRGHQGRAPPACSSSRAAPGSQGDQAGAAAGAGADEGGPQERRC